MAFKPDFEIKSTKNCNKLKFIDTTCVVNPLRPALCCDGYGSEGNINKWDIGKTQFNWITPSNNTYTNLNPGFTPGTPAKASFTLGGDTSGVAIVCVGGKEVGKAIFVTTLDAMVEALVADINSKNEQTGWRAIFTGSTITVYHATTGIEFNDLSLEVYVTDTITVIINEALTSGADDGEDYIYFTVEEIFGLGSKNCPKPNTPFETGVHTVVYNIYNISDELVGTISKKVLIDCAVLNCMRDASKLLMSGTCKCEQGKLASRITVTRARYDAILQMMKDCDFKCANDAIIELASDCKEVCLDC